MNILPPWFRIHLSTAVALMIGASVILGLNVTHRNESEMASSYGWPMTCLVLVESDVFSPNVQRQAIHLWNYQNLITDVATAIVLITTLGIVFEKRIDILARHKKERM